MRTSNASERALRRSALASFIVLFTVLAAHAVLETARDALFLARLSPLTLAWAYLCIAGLALAALAALRRFARHWNTRSLLVAILAGSAAITVLFARLTASGAASAFGLYVWVGLVATLAVPAFWLLVARSYSVVDAKRMFVWIAAGGALGATVGSFLAAGLAGLLSAHALVYVGAALLALSVVATWVLAPRPGAESETAPQRPSRQRSRAPDTRRYLRTLLTLALLSTAALTLGDLTFKTVVAGHYDATDLVAFFGVFYAGLNLLGLLVQVILAPRLLRAVGVSGGLIILPVLIAATSLGFIVTGAFVWVLLLKLGDGSLRHSLHRVTSEIMFLPLPAPVQEQFKTSLDALGHRGGQALAALLGLAAAGLSFGAAGLATLTAALTAGWLVSVVLCRRAYLQQFRDTLRSGGIERAAAVPDLDLTSAEVVLQALSSPDELQATSALDLLAAQRRTRLIPALVLYHPSTLVVQRALELLDVGERADVAAVLTHLAAHPDPEVRASALIAAAGANVDEAALHSALDDEAVVVRATAAVALTRCSGSLADLAVRRIRQTVDHGDTTARCALARAIGRLRATEHRPTLTELLLQRDSRVVVEAARAIARIPDPSFVPALLPKLEDRTARAAVQRALVAVGPRSIRPLIAELERPATPIRLRRHLPRTLGQFPTAEATVALVRRLPVETDGMTRFKILRALGAMRATHPELPVDEDVIRHYIRETMSYAARCACWQDAVTAHFAADEAMPPGAVLLASLLGSKRNHAAERVFRAYGVLVPHADLKVLHDGFRSSNPRLADAGRELAEHVMDGATARALAAILDDVDPRDRRERLGSLAPPVMIDYESTLGAMLRESSAALQAVAAYHAAEIKATSLWATLEQTRSAAHGIVARAFDQALEGMGAHV